MICAALAFLTNGTPAFAQDAVVKKIIEIGKTDNQVMHQIDILTNRFGGRPIGSDAFENAAEWMVREYKSWGLDVKLEEAGSIPVGFNRGPWFGRLIGENSMPLHFVTPSYTSGTKGVQRGHVLIEPRTDEEFAQMKGRLKGAWVLISGTSRGFPMTTQPPAIHFAARSRKRTERFLKRTKRSGLITARPENTRNT